MDAVLKYLEHLNESESARSEASREINSIVGMLRNGWTVEKIMMSLHGSKTVRKFKVELAKGRISASERFGRAGELWLDEFSSRYSTPEIIAQYRSERLSEFNILDIGSGAGLQSIFFGMNTQVTGIEQDRRRFLLAKLNRHVYRESSAEFLNASFPGDLDRVFVEPPLAIFSDPLRLPGRKSDPGKLSPSPMEVIKRLSGRTNVFVFDLPVLMKPGDVAIDGEYEYASVNGRLVRLTLYNGDIAEHPRSAIILPERRRYSGNPEVLTFRDGYSDYITVPDPALVKSGLLWKATGNYDFVRVSEDSRRLVLSSDSAAVDLPGEHYRLIATYNADDYTDKISELRPRSVYLRFGIGSDIYYKIRDRIKTGENSELILYLFRHREKILVCTKI